jgi:hypothetical protein
VQNHNVAIANPFVTKLLKQDGEKGIDGSTSMTHVVKEYFEHDMVTSISIIMKF